MVRVVGYACTSSKIAPIGGLLILCAVAPSTDGSRRCAGNRASSTEQRSGARALTFDVNGRSPDCSAQHLEAPGGVVVQHVEYRCNRIPRRRPLAVVLGSSDASQIGNAGCPSASPPR